MWVFELNNLFCSVLLFVCGCALALYIIKNSHIHLWICRSRFMWRKILLRHWFCKVLVLAPIIDVDLILKWIFDIITWIFTLISFSFIFFSFRIQLNSWTWYRQAHDFDASAASFSRKTICKQTECTLKQQYSLHCAFF